MNHPPFELDFGQTTAIDLKSLIDTNLFCGNCQQYAPITIRYVTPDQMHAIVSCKRCQSEFPISSAGLVDFDMQLFASETSDDDHQVL